MKWRGFVLMIGMLNLCNLTLFGLPWVRLLEVWLTMDRGAAGAELAEGVTVESPDEAAVLVLILGLILLLNAGAGAFSLYKGLSAASGVRR